MGKDLREGVEGGFRTAQGARWLEVWRAISGGAGASAWVSSHGPRRAAAAAHPASRRSPAVGPVEAQKPPPPTSGPRLPAPAAAQPPHPSAEPDSETRAPTGPGYPRSGPPRPGPTTRAEMFTAKKPNPIQRVPGLSHTPCVYRTLRDNHIAASQARDASRAYHESVTKVSQKGRC